MRSKTPEQPAFSWSNARDRALSECARKYFFTYYGAHGGWNAEASPEARLIYRLKQLDSLPMLLGKAVHECAQTYVKAIRNGEDPPPREDAKRAVRRQMNEAWAASRNRPAFIRAPKHITMLQERYYPERMPSSDRLSAISGRIDVLVDTLYDWPGWHQIMDALPSDILVIDGLESADYQGHPLYAVPDLVYRDLSGVWTVLDWKTGREDGVEVQLALYALYCRQKGIIPAGEDVCGLVVNLREAEERVIEVTAADIAAAERRIAESTSRMADLVTDRDVVRNEAVPLAQVPWPSSTQACRWCPFFEVCEPDLETRRIEGPF